MDADEKLALKKAYADIIMNISTETAARVLASERKSAMFQHELKVAKEEGVRMLVRLKQMMDSQSREAEAVSLTQRKKIEELEAQLQEAEDIVRDLRDKLENVQAKLERVKSGNFHHLNDVCSKEVPMENRVTLHQSGEYLPSNGSPDPTVPDLRQKNECLKCCNKTVCSCDVFTGNQDLPSIIVVDKDPGLYRKGRTQRIRACERNLLGGDSCLSDETDKARRNPKAPALVAKIPSELETKLLGDTNFGTSKSLSFFRKRKRASRQKKTILLLGGKQSHPTSKLDHLVNAKAHSAGNLSETGPQLSRYNGEPQSQLQPAKASENVRNIVEDEGEKEKMVPLKGVTEVSDSLLSLKDVEKVDVPSPGSESKLSDATKGITSHPVTLNGIEIKYTYQRKRKRQCLSLSEMNGSHETGKKTGDRKNGDQKLEQPKPNLLRESLGVIGSCATMKKTGDEGTGVQKLEETETGWLEGSLREHKRMIQVARQLLSLSDEKLWH